MRGNRRAEEELQGILQEWRKKVFERFLAVSLLLSLIAVLGDFLLDAGHRIAPGNYLFLILVWIVLAALLALRGIGLRARVIGVLAAGYVLAAYCLLEYGVVDGLAYLFLLPVLTIIFWGKLPSLWATASSILLLVLFTLPGAGGILGSAAAATEPTIIPVSILVISLSMGLIYLLLKFLEDRIEQELRLKADLEEARSGLAERNAGLEGQVREQIEELQQGNKVLTAMYEIIDATGTSRDLRTFSGRIHSIIGELMYAKNFFIALYDEASGILSFPYCVDERDEAPAPRPLEGFRGMTGYVIRTGETLHHDSETVKDLIATGEIELIGHANTAGIGVPLAEEGKVIGALFVSSYDPGTRYSRQDEEVLALVAQYVATALKRFRALEAERRRSAELTIINGVQDGILSGLGMDELIDLVGDRIREAFRSPDIVISLYDEGADLVSYRYAYEDGRRLSVEPMPPYPGGMLRRLIESGRPGCLVYDGSAEGELPVVPGTGRCRKGVAAPIFRGKRLLGVIQIEDHDRGGAIDEGQLGFLDTLASSLGVAIENAELLAQKNEAMEALRSSEERYRMIAENSSDVIWTADTELRYSYLSPAYCWLTGHAVEESLGRPVAADLTDASALAVMEGFARRSSAIGGGRDETALLEYGLSCKDGSARMVESSIKPMRGSGGRLTGFIGVTRDIGARKQAERRMLEAKEAAEEANRLKSEFLANMSHEIRTPMNAIIGMAHLAFRTDLDARQRDYVGKIDQAAHNLLQIINDILDFSKIEAGKLDMEQAPFRLDEVMAGISTVIGMKAQEKGLELIFDMPAVIPGRLVGDPLRLNQVLVNLCGNAIKFTERGEVLVGLRLLERSDRAVRLEFRVEDSGIGLSEEQIGRLFRSFSQADASTTRKYGGTGLGLSISRRLVEMMGGSISVESEPGAGSCFRFDASFQLQEGPEEPLAEPIAGLRGTRVLVVDDNQSSRAILAALAEELGFEAGSASSGEEALAELGRASAAGSPYGLVLLDWKMPGMDGIEAARRIKAGGSGAPKLVMVTAYGSDELQREAEDSEVDAFLVKPVSPSTLVGAIKAVFGGLRAAARRERRARSRVDLSEISRPIRGARILLAEDNDLNQQVAIELLEGEGLRVTLAVDGRDAVAKMRPDFHAVLMDVQMPNMDGYEASRLIRANRAYDGIPIIAMTANAMERDLELAREAGMESHVAKPVDPEKLFRTLLACVKPDPSLPLGAAAEDRGEEPSLAGGEGARLPPSLPGIDLEEGLSHLAGKEEAYARILRQFPGRQAGTAGSIRSLLAEGRTDEASRAAHSLKSVAGNIGASRLSAAAGKLEAALRGGRGAEEAASLAEGLDAELGPVVAGLRAWLGAAPSEGPGEGRPGGEAELAPSATWASSLDEIEGRLRDDDIAAIRLIESLAARGGPSAGLSLEKALSKAEEYDFEGALAEIESIRKRRGAAAGTEGT